MRSPLMYRHCTCLVWLGHADPFAAHLRIELHFDGPFPQVVRAKKDKQDHEAKKSGHDDHEAIEVQLGFSLDELDREEARVVDGFSGVKVNRPKNVAQLFLRACVTLVVAKLKAELLHSRFARQRSLPLGGVLLLRRVLLLPPHLVLRCGTGCCLPSVLIAS